MYKKLRASFRLSLGIAAVSVVVIFLLEHLIFGIEFSAKWVILHAGLFLVILDCSWMILEIFVFRKIRSISDKVNAQLAPNLMSQTSSLIGGLQKNVDTLTVERKNEIERLQKLETYRKELLGNVSHE